MTQATRLALLIVVAMFGAAATAVPAQAQTSCTITWDGQLSDRWFEMDPRGAGTADDVYNWSPERYPTTTDDVCFPNGAVASTRQVTTNTPSVRSFTISAGATLTVDNVQMIVAADSTNAGTLNMSGAPLSINDGDLNNGGEGLTNTGTINFTPLAGNALQIFSGDLHNQGTINVNDPDASIQRSGAGFPDHAIQTNQGTIAISAGSNLRSINSTFVHGNGSVIAGAGSMSMDQARLEVSGNSQITGVDVNLNNVTFAGTAGSSTTGNVDFVGSFGDIEGTVPAGIAIDIDTQTVETVSTSNVVNAGTIRLNGDSDLKINPNVADTNPLVNTGTIEYTAGGAPGLRTIFGKLLNQGTILVNHPEADFRNVAALGELTNEETVTVSAGNTLRMLNASFINAQTGVLNGAGTVNQGNDTAFLEVRANSTITGVDYNLGGSSDLRFVSASGASGNVDFPSNAGNNTLTGNVPVGYTLDLAGNNTVVRAPASFTNAGTINLTTGGTELRTEDGDAGTTETLTNTGTIASSGTGGIAQLSGDLINQGQLTAGHPTTRFDRQSEARSSKLSNAAGGTITVLAGGGLASVPGEAQALENAGTVQVNGTLAPLGYTQTAGQTTLATAPPTHSLGIPAGSGVVTVQGGTLRGGGIVNASVVNSGGTVAPGTSPGTLSILGDYAQGAGANLAIEVFGPAAGTGHDQLVVGGTASLAGTLTVDTANFTPATGQQFKIIDAPAPPTAPTVSGGFTTRVQNGRDYDVVMNPTDVTLTALAPPGTPDLPQPQPQPPDTNPDDPPAVDNAACERARDKLAKAKKKLKKLKNKGAPKQAIKRGKQKVAKAKDAVKQACA